MGICGEDLGKSVPHFQLTIGNSAEMCLVGVQRTVNKRAFCSGRQTVILAVIRKGSLMESGSERSAGIVHVIHQHLLSI